jgi:maltose O-acetyltransferase
MEDWMRRLREGWVGMDDPDIGDYDRALAACAEKLSLFNSPQTGPEERRRILVSLTGAELQGRTRILAPFRCDLGFNIKLGKDVLVNYNCTFLDTAEISVGDNTMIGPDCHLVTAVHPIDPVERRDWRVRGSPIRIGCDVWLCANVTVVPGVTIGDGSVVGAGSVVTKDVPPGTVVAGNPARIIKRSVEES